MQRLKFIFFLTAVFVSLTTLSSTSYAQQNTTKPQGNTKGRYFVDKNGDGICDNYGTNAGRKNGQGKGKGGGNGTGNCKYAGTVKDSTTGAVYGVCDGTGPKGRCARNGK